MNTRIIHAQIYDPAADLDLSGGVVAKTYNVVDPLDAKLSGLLRKVSFQPVFANYTSVTVKAQATIDGTNWIDVPGATTSTTTDIVTFSCFDAKGPYKSVRIHVTGTLSASADTMDIYASLEIEGY